MTYERLFKLKFQNQMTIEYLYQQTKANDQQKAIQTDTYSHTIAYKQRRNELTNED